MRVKRYTAENIRKAMQLVKDELGEEAIILSNRIVGDMVEIIATEEPPIKRFDTTVMQAKTQDFSESQLIEKNSIDQLTLRVEFFQNLINKYTSLFDFRMHYQTPYVFYLFNLLYQYGFSDVYAKHLVKEFTQKNLPKKQIFDNLINLIQSSTLFSDTNTLGSYLFLGPSGSGKTSAIAKFATSYRLNHPDAIISFIYLDLEKNGGERNLAQYAKLLSTKYSYADNLDIFKQIMINSQTHDLILIDTSLGFQLEQFEEVKTILSSWNLVTLGIVPSTHDYQVIKKYFNNLIIDEIIITKIDESPKIGVGLSLGYELKKPISYVSTGAQLANQFPSANINVIAKILFDTELTLTNEASSPLVLDEAVIWKMSGAIS